MLYQKNLLDENVDNRVAFARVKNQKTQPSSRKNSRVSRAKSHGRSLRKSKFDFSDVVGVSSAYDDMIADMRDLLVKKSMEINIHDDRNGQQLITL